MSVRSKYDDWKLYRESEYIRLQGGTPAPAVLFDQWLSMYRQDMHKSLLAECERRGWNMTKSNLEKLWKEGQPEVQP